MQLAERKVHVYKMEPANAELRETHFGRAGQGLEARAFLLLGRADGNSKSPNRLTGCWFTQALLPPPPSSH